MAEAGNGNSENKDLRCGQSGGWERLRTVMKVHRAVSMLRELPALRRLKESETRRSLALQRASTVVVEQFTRKAKRALCSYLLEEGHEGVLGEVADVAIDFEEVEVGEALGHADLLLTNLPSALDEGDSNKQVQWYNSLPDLLKDDLHYAPTEMQRLTAHRTYTHAIADAFENMLGVRQIASKIADDTPGATKSYPSIVKPARKKNRRRYLVFNDKGLETAKNKVASKCVVDEFVEHSGALYHVFVVDMNIFVAERPCLPHINANMSPEELRKVAEEIGGEFIDSPQEGRYLTFDSEAFAAKCRREGAAQAGAMPLDEVPALSGIAGRLEQVANTLTDALGIGMFGIDILLNRQQDTFHLVDLSLMPAFEGTDDMLAVTALHLFEECQQRAVRVDIRSAVNNPKEVVDLMIAQHPGWNNVDRDAVTINVLSASTKGDKTGLVVSLAVEGKDTLVCRLRGVVERTAFEQAIADKMMDFPNTPLMGSYFGSRVLIGYTEGLIKGAQLEKVLDQVDRRRLCLNLGAALRALHTRKIDVQSPDYLGVPLCVSRLRTYSIIAWEAVNHVKPLQPQFKEVFAAVQSYDVSRLPPEAREEIFGHFDCNLTNVLVDMSAPADEAPKVSFIDWEQAGPNIAAYDFGKFLVSYTIAVSVDDQELEAMLTALVEGYAPEWDDLAKARFKMSLLAMIPYVAAVNFMSNIRHAATEVGDRWVNRGTAHYGVFARYKHNWEIVTQAATTSSPSPSQEEASPRSVCGRRRQGGGGGEGSSCALS